VAEHGEFIGVAWQGRVALSAAALFDGQVAGFMPAQAMVVSVINSALVWPLGGAEHLLVVAMQAGNVLQRTGPAIGDHEHVLRQADVFTNQTVRLVDGRMAIAVAVETVSENGHSAKVIDDGQWAEENRFAVGGVAVTDVGR
jgi:hypothetical protein